MIIEKRSKDEAFRQPTFRGYRDEKDTTKVLYRKWQEVGEKLDMCCPRNQVGKVFRGGRMKPENCPLVFAAWRSLVTLSGLQSRVHIP